MTVRRLLSASLLLIALTLCSPAAGQEKKEKSKTGLDEPTTALMGLLEEAFKAHDYRKDPKHGDGRTPYEEISSKPGLLVGLDIYPGRRDKTTDYVRGVRPIFLQNDGKKYTGKAVGWVTTGTATHVEAKPGYAVAGLKVHTEFGELAGMSVVFAKITESGLEMEDSYESKYLGHNDPTTARKVVCTGEPILGIHGLIADNAKSHDFGLGLVVLNKEEAKKRKPKK